MHPTEGKTFRLSGGHYNDETQEYIKDYSLEVPSAYDNVPEEYIHYWTEYKKFKVKRWYERHFNTKETELNYEHSYFPFFSVEMSQGGYDRIILPFEYYKICL